MTERAITKRVLEVGERVDQKAIVQLHQFLKCCWFSLSTEIHPEVWMESLDLTKENFYDNYFFNVAENDNLKCWLEWLLEHEVGIGAYRVQDLLHRYDLMSVQRANLESGIVSQEKLSNLEKFWESCVIHDRLERRIENKLDEDISQELFDLMEEGSDLKARYKIILANRLEAEAQKKQLLAS